MNGDDLSNNLAREVRDVRADKHAKWEEEKNMQSRLGVLGRRVKELDEENLNLRSQLKEWKEKANKEGTAKQEILKQTNATLKRNNQESEQRRVTQQDVGNSDEVSFSVLLFYVY